MTLVCPRYNYSVSQVLIKKDDQEDIIGRCIQQSGPFVLKDQHETIRVSCADPNLGVTFELNNVVKADEGRYRCLISTEYGVEIFTYEVTVLAQGECLSRYGHLICFQTFTVLWALSGVLDACTKQPL